MIRLVPFLALAVASEAFAAGPYTICVQIDIQTSDSGLVANGITEDYWVGANSASPYRVAARGVRVKLSNGDDWHQDIDTDPTTGCATVSPSEAGPYTVRVYAHSKDANGNIVRVHTNGTDTTDWYPNPGLSVAWAGQTLKTTGTNTYVVDGRGDDRWTTFASAAFGLYRFHSGNAGDLLHIGFDPVCDNSGSTHDLAEMYIESNQVHHIRVGRCAAAKTDSRQKMLVSHEMGHALLRLRYGQDGDDDPRDQTFFPPISVTLVNPPYGGGCYNVNSYGMNSLEYNSQAFKEGFADFVATRIWNNADPRATYAYRRRAYDAETWDVWGGSFASGGFTNGWCDYETAWNPWWDPNNLDNRGVTTKGDVGRFLWDLRTASCADRPTDVEIMDIYTTVHDFDDWELYPLTTQNYDEALMYTISAHPGLSDCVVDASWPLAEYNGILGP